MNTMIDQAALIDTMTGLVIFEISGTEFCADIRHISAIINPAELNQAQNLYSEANPHIDINNLSIPLIQIHRYYQMEIYPKTDDTRILIIEPDDILLGFFVERVKEIFTMSREFKDKLTFTPVKDEGYLTGILNFEGRTIYLPDFNKIVTDEKLF